MISTALSEVGYLEKASDRCLEDKTGNAGKANYTKYGAWYGINPGAWCAMFISWCAQRSGNADALPKHASCSAGIAAFKKLGRWYDRRGFEPKAGDIIYFCDKNGSPQHVGLVTCVTKTQVMTVEGNTTGGSTVVPNGGSVSEKSYSRDYSRILGYGRPDYREDDVKYEDFLTFMKRYEAEKAAEQPSDWSKDAREWAEKEGVIRGDGEGMRYKCPLTREEYVVMEYRRRSERA